MSSKRLVVLEESDYQDLLHPNKLVETKNTQTDKPEDSPDLSQDPDQPEEPSEEPEGEPDEPDGDSAFLASVPKVAHQEAQNLLDRLKNLPSFDLDPESGEIKINGTKLDNYNIQRFLTATCTKSARDDIPVPLRLFLRKHDIRQFRNKRVRLPRAEKWKSQFD